jgi:ribosomal-protein-alanine N-acetyltransferase
MALPRVINTPRLQLRDPRPGDADAAFAAYTADPEVLRYLGWRAHASSKTTREQFSFDVHRWLKGSAWVWVMTRQPDEAANASAGEVFGQIELVPQSHPSELAHHLRLGYLMARSHWGQGLMAEAVRAVLDAAMAEPPVWRVDALCDVDNHASAALLARVGMQREGLLRQVVRHPNVSDAPRDAWVFALTNRHKNGGAAT